MFIEGKSLYMMFVETPPYKPQYSFVFLNAVSYVSDNLANDVEAFDLVLSSSMQSRTYPIILQMMWKLFDFIYLTRESLHVKFIVSNLTT